MNGKGAAITFSLLVHLAAFALVAVSFAQRPGRLGGIPMHADTVQAVAVDDAQVEAQVRKLQNEELSQREADDARRKRVQQELAQARQAKAAEDQRIAALKQKRQQEQLAADQQRKQLAALQAQQAQLQAKQAQLEKQRQLEQQRLAKVEQQRKAAEAKAKAEAAKRDFAAKLAAEQQKLDAMRRRQQENRVKAQYMSEVTSRVQSNWLRPAGSADKFECEVTVTQGPDGTVESARVTKSCGNPGLDRSVEAAVLKSSPLPLPSDPTLFETTLKFKFNPQ